jgi:hypothetical protein
MTRGGALGQRVASQDDDAAQVRSQFWVLNSPLDGHGCAVT